MVRTALITGITGQDGSYLAELLLEKKYEVHGILRRSSTSSLERLKGLYLDTGALRPGVFLHCSDLQDAIGLANLVRSIAPDEVYHLAAQTDVAASFEIPEYTAEVNGVGTVRMLEAVRGIKDVRFYQASSAEMFGDSGPPQNEATLPRPVSPYGCSKAYAYWMAASYRKSYGVHVCNGILFNHESERRGTNFVTRKISRAAARISQGLQQSLHLGNLDAIRDWGYAPEYVETMWKLLQHDRPDDFVIATGEGHTVREFCEAAFGHLGLDWKEYVIVDPKYLRPAETLPLIGDSKKAQHDLGWSPRVQFSDLVKIMVDADVADLATLNP